MSLSPCERLCCAVLASHYLAPGVITGGELQGAARSPVGGVTYAPPASPVSVSFNDPLR